MKIPSKNRGSGFAGTWYTILAFGLWGVLPVYWKLLKAVSPYEIVADRGKDHAVCAKQFRSAHLIRRGQAHSA